MALNFKVLFVCILFFGLTVQNSDAFGKCFETCMFHCAGFNPKKDLVCAGYCGVKCAIKGGDAAREYPHDESLPNNDSKVNSAPVFGKY